MTTLQVKTQTKIETLIVFQFLTVIFLLFKINFLKLKDFFC